MNDYELVLIFKRKLNNGFIQDIVKNTPTLKIEPKFTGKFIIQATIEDGLRFHCYTI